MSNYKSYPKYKNSNIPLLGKIPEHWEVVKLIGICHFIRGNSSFKKDELQSIGKYVALQYGKTYKINEVDNRYQFYVNDEFYKDSQLVKNGDVIIISTSETIEDLGHSVYYNRSDLGLLGGEQVLLRPKNNEFSGKYLYYSSKTFTNELRMHATGVKVFRFNISDLKSIYTFTPPISEQTAIARFLDYKLAKINRFIQKKKQLIKLLNEQKAAIINQAVTKGLDANVKMKPSGIEWLGDIPEHWEVRKLKYVANFQSGEMITSETIADFGEFPVYGGGGFRGYTNGYTNEGHHVLIGRQGALCGNIKYAEGKFWASEHAIVTYPKVEIETLFLGEIMRVANLGNLSQTAAQPGISIGQIKNVKVPIPPLKEQSQIVDFISKETCTIYTTISKIEKELALTEEYKTALIAEVVTGKIDVRGYEVPEVMEEETYEDSDSYHEEEELGMATVDGVDYQTEEKE